MLVNVGRGGEINKFSPGNKKNLRMPLWKNKIKT